MKRNPSLQPLSREHHTALSLANACVRAAQSGDATTVAQACQRAILAYTQELAAHFSIEEQSLLPLLQGAETQALVQRTLAEHQQLRGLLERLRQNETEALNSFGTYLMAHVRFEERELFPVLENLLQ
jgi:iron-sulfur cluster repair protein YtfE (RIC family)